VLLLSAELSELRSLSDRLAVLYKGQIVATLDRGQLAAAGALDQIGAMMTGAMMTGATMTGDSPPPTGDGARDAQR
jgi:simple sugar transport system ATP-binding protein